jgi:hypothetical protein
MPLCAIDTRWGGTPSSRAESADPCDTPTTASACRMQCNHKWRNPRGTHAGTDSWITLWTMTTIGRPSTRQLK